MTVVVATLMTSRTLAVTSGRCVTLQAASEAAPRPRKPLLVGQAVHDVAPASWW